MSLLKDPELKQSRPSTAGLPGLRGLQHIGITVPNLQEAVDFFVEVLGCEPYFTFGPFKFDDDWMTRHLNVHPRAEIRDFQMVRCGNGTNLEIFEYAAPDQNTRLPRNSDVGGHHLAFYVDDMDQAVAYLKSRHVTVLDTPSTFTDGPAAGLTWVYFLAPWGLQLELVSFPAGMGYERDQPRLLWDPRFPER
ncbi:VOC family protein [Pseudogulbenkiania ferrooxidans]|uniref:Glyoxalase/bleomycin resistance protein/dioxygenase n=1 Tax=Pseudogulbenkiania ferrooxidans 2002 TaxID=279714 RepID=B9Z009_9NEIS|nr:VOC family protein [Pseudogulbenkiania ferrooxidans]EEG09892.1 Glyoxalase/bleomycin resistance protein/dioxygenase [Pseudogulbenkiania ferrooxidans 2002]